jgi:signal transduction histidine kinase
MQRGINEAYVWDCLSRGYRLSKYLRNNSLVIILVIATAVSLSILAYQFSNQTLDRINQVSINGIRTNAEIQALDLSNSLANKLGDVTGTLKLISNAPAITEANLTRSKIILNQAKNSSNGLVDFYLWLDKDGKIVWISNLNETAYSQYNGFDLSYRLYFLTPQQSHQVYYSSVTDSNDRINRLYISYPILFPSNESNDTKTGDNFRGIIAAGIRTDVLGKFLEGQLAPKLQSEVVVLDNTGIVLYSNHRGYEGENVFGIHYQSFLASMSVDTLQALNSGLTKALHGKDGSSEIVLDSAGSKGTFVYKPILLDKGQFGVLYVIAPHTLASDVTSLISQQSTLFLAIIVLIAGVASGSVFLILTWNKRLGKIVKERTGDLEGANRSLQDAFEQLKVHEKLQTEFINVAAHELRTPIQPLLSAAELMDSKSEDNGDIQVSRKEIDLILRNARRLERLSADILQVSRIDSGALRLDLEDFDISTAIDEVVKDATMQPGFDQSKLQITCSVSEILVRADREKIIEVLSNLLSNAIKFTGKGSISINAQKDTAAGLAVVTVVDSGVGIAPDVLPKLFEKFVTKSDKGTGIGLYISKKIVEAHGGTIAGQNRWDGAGASFTFTIPLAKN